MNGGNGRGDETDETRLDKRGEGAMQCSTSARDSSAQVSSAVVWLWWCRTRQEHPGRWGAGGRGEEKNRRGIRLRDSERLTVNNAALKLRLDACTLEPVDLAHRRQLAVEELITLHLSEQRRHLLPRDGGHWRRHGNLAGQEPLGQVTHAFSSFSPEAS